MTPRKPAARAGSSWKISLPLRPVRKRIWEEARELAGSDRPIGATLSRRFELPPATIEAVLVWEGIRHERTATALRTGIVNALEIAREASEENEAAA